MGTEVKNITDEIPFEIPENWAWGRFSLISKINGGFAFKSENYTTKEKGVRVLRISDFDESGIKNHKMVFHPFNQSMQEFLLEDKDIVMCMTGGTVGKTLLITSLDEQMLVNQRVAAIKINNKISNDYIYVFLTSYFVKDIIKSEKNSTNDNISMDLIKSFLLPLPPLTEQERIVAEIEKYEPLIAEYDKLEQQSTKLDNEIKDKLKKSILQYAIEGKLVQQNPDDEPASVLLEKIRVEKKAQLGKKYVDSYIYKGDDNCYYEKIGENIKNISEEISFEIPASWSWNRLGNVGDWGAGATPNRGVSEYYNGTIPWLKTGELNNGIVYDSVEKITDKALKECSLRYNKKGDVLIAMYGATIGKLAIAGINLTTNQACCACTPNKSLNNQYLFYYLMSQKDNFIKMGEGGAQPNISREKLINYIIPIPPYSEQIEIHKQIQKTLSLIT